MNLDLRSVEYVVFDEADRLFEMGFATALSEIVHRLPASRQTILFSATLPKSLVDFARAGLQNPKLVRLDAESKISADLRMAFLSVKQDEKDASLLLLLRDVIGVPFGSNKPAEDDADKSMSDNKGKRRARETFTAPHQTLVFAATKHHVEYLTNLLTTAGYAVSHIYGSLDQGARSQQMEQFRRGQTNILVVTDVAARGIDIPVLENVVNYDFPHGARIFVHRVGRTARAGRQGWAWSFVSNTELPHLLDLQLFLTRPIISSVASGRIREESTYTENLVLGSFSRETVDEEVEYVRSLYMTNNSLPSLRDVMRKGHSMYERSKGKASQASYRRAKEMSKDPAQWGLVSASTGGGIHPVLLFKGKAADELSNRREGEAKRTALLRMINTFRPAETALELGTKGKAGNAELMKERRKALSKAVTRATAPSTVLSAAADDADDDEDTREVEMADEDDIQVRIVMVIPGATA
jgi:ATP-dependent RNA helicase DDX54/DBP10